MTDNDQLWDVCSDQEAVDLIRNNHDPQAASKILVDHALAHFSTDNLSVMVVRFDSKKLQLNTATDIGVEADPANRSRGAVSEVEMIVGEAKKASSRGNRTEAGMGVGANTDDKQNVLHDLQEEDAEPGPELSPDGAKEAEKITWGKLEGSTESR